MRNVFYRKIYPYPGMGRQRGFHEIRGIDPRIMARQALARRVAGCAHSVSEMAYEMVRTIANGPLTPRNH